MIFDRDDLVERWRDLRGGGVLLCHKTDSTNDTAAPKWQRWGFGPVPENARPRECAGSAAGLARELRLLEDAGSYEAYAERRGPAALPKTAAEMAVRRLAGPVGIRPPLRLPDVAESDVIDVPASPSLSFAEYATEAELRALMGAAASAMGQTW